MRTVTLQDAESNLSRLIVEDAGGDGFLIVDGTGPLAMVRSLRPHPQEPASRLGFLSGDIAIPDDFDSMGQDEILALFHNEP